MWEFFLGVSLACFFAVYWLKRGARPKPRQHEVVYAPSDEVLQYKTRKKSNDYGTAASYSSEESKSPVSGAAPSYRAPRAPEPKPFTYPEKDEFVEYAASVVTEEPVVNSPQTANIAAEQPKNMSEDAENEEDDEKKSKFSALRFFNS